MLEHCADACARQAELDIEMAEAIERKIGHITSFFDLEAQDIDENVITFDKYKVREFGKSSLVCLSSGSSRALTIELS